MQMTLTVICISKGENHLEMTDFTKYLRIAKMSYGVRTEASAKYYITVTLTITVQQQQVFLQLIMAYPIVYFMCQPFLNIFWLNYFGTIYKICLSEKAPS